MRPILLILALLALLGCDEAPPDAAPAASELERAQLTDPTRLEAVSTAPLSLREALAREDNLLEADPTPWRPLEASPGGTLRRGSHYVIPDAYTWFDNNTVVVGEINTYVSEPIAIRHQRDPDRWAPGLAEHVSVSDDGTVYTVTLRPGLSWHRPHPEAHAILPSGSSRLPVTSEDFAFTFKLLKDRRIEDAAPARSWYADCVDLVPIDDRRFKMVWSRAGLDTLVGTLDFKPIPRHVFSYDSNGKVYNSVAPHIPTHWYRWPIGAGPYEVTEHLDASLGFAYLRLERSPTYHSAPPAIEAIEYHSVASTEAGVEDIAQGKLDLLEIPAEDYPALVLRAPPGNAFDRGDVKLGLVRELGYTYIAWNLESGPTTATSVRHALAHVLNRERIVAEVLHGLGEVLAGPFPNSGRARDPDVQPLAYDPLRAAALLEAEGWRDRDGDGVRESEFGAPLELDILAIGTAENVAFLEIFKRDLEEIGARVTLSFERSSDLKSRVRTLNFNGFVGGWGLDWENDPYQLWHSSQADIDGSSNPIGFRNAEADRLIEAIRAETDADERIPDLHAFYRLLHDEQPYAFLFERDVVYALSPRLHVTRFQKYRPHDNTLPWWIEGE